MNDPDIESAVEILLQTLRDNHRVIGLYADLDVTEFTRMFLLEFPLHVWFGMDASVGFAKATHMHECAFEVPMSQLLLETGSPSTIPPMVGQLRGRDAFCHSGMIPLIAKALAAHKGGSHTAEDIARAASINTVVMYTRIHLSRDGEEKKSTIKQTSFPYA
jgi:Tat protein secretion system quality control protein TatD with DNase activity